MSEATTNSDNLYAEITATIEREKAGMTTYQIIGTLMSVMLRFWQLNAQQQEKEQS